MNLRTISISTIACIMLVSLVGCGPTGTGNPIVTIQSNPLAGPQAAGLYLNGPKYIHLFNSLLKGFDLLFGVKTTEAAVSGFSIFKMCNDTLIFKDANGTVIPMNGSSSPEVGQGLLDFSPTSHNPMTIGTLEIPVGTVISEINITFAVVPSVCSGANYSVQFDNGAGGGLKNVTQNTAFRFNFTGGNLLVGPDTQTITLLFGDIVNGMVALGAGLDNSTIQTVNVGQAR